jgi:hypothetical protein
MHTLKIVMGGFLLLGICLFLGRSIAGPTTAAAGFAVKCFLAIWLAVTLINMWVGVNRAGYSLKDEAPIALLVFLVPALIAIVVWWRWPSH